MPSISVEITTARTDIVPMSARSFPVAHPVIIPRYDVSLITHEAIRVQLTGARGAPPYMYPVSVFLDALHKYAYDSKVCLHVFEQANLKEATWENEWYLWQGAIFFPPSLHVLCTNCGHQIVAHAEGRCLFDTTRLSFPNYPEALKGRVFRLGRGTYSMADLVRGVLRGSIEGDV